MARNPIHPGMFLADELEAQGMTPTQLAATLHVPPIRQTGIDGGCRLTAQPMARHIGGNLDEFAETL